MMSSTYNSIFSLYEAENVAGGNPRCGDIGGTRFFGLLMGQNQNALIAFDTLLKVLEQQGTPACTIIELGTSHGGLSVFLQLYSIINAIRFVTYDYYDFVPTYAKLIEMLHIDYRQADVLHDDVTIEEIGLLIAGEGTSVVLCDNGNKALEFVTYSRYLKTGDLILAHDYAPNTKIHQEEMNNKIWSYYEISDTDIAAPCKEHSLVPFLQEPMRKAAWSCHIKSFTR